MGKTTILVVDDEKEIRELIEIYLRNEGYDVITAENGLQALELAKSRNIQLIILDIMLPNIDGIQICKKVREHLDVPIIMLSAKREDNDKILGIITGADDYVTKPFNPLELVVRVKAQLRRYLKAAVVPKSNEIVIDDLVINSDTHRVYVSGEEIKFTSKEFEILKLLAEHRDVVFSSRNIYEHVWKEEFYESDSTIMTHIKNIREKLGDSVKNPKYIKTIWGVGYKIEK
ncbi:DNA-binding response OmpR family regulator [Clostridium tetanomorphum]|uniref:Stage 0 sporulation protein A homolog n=1 Tax=Clostridium tetanomorphum TaxID=1553 RepID=A0A923IYU0_CLOTT|nr:response regulator transcription factor [Clostridium tetanomorphum]KAJ49246.1 response regulator protein [Clostridium tetanomorphum DSM 665]KAJ52730.1 response regulator protein [Clostridium tetanomorphum DSM 665]MBC2396716.1 response regulator transcription factor [Clostridium tetanomorphum]MBP1863325.1 DNA-binding response OmpR family regulator [Clostridium tetanomorphum]NRS84433.1 DNA-binding response OmpR family regulator [Clostridium tetanomorphum]